MSSDDPHIVRFGGSPNSAWRALVVVVMMIKQRLERLSRVRDEYKTVFGDRESKREREREVIG